MDGVSWLIFVSHLCDFCFFKPFAVYETAGDEWPPLRRGEVFSSYDTHNGRLGDEYARMTVEMASKWKRVIAGGERPVRVLLLGRGLFYMICTLLSTLSFGLYSVPPFSRVRCEWSDASCVLL